MRRLAVATAFVLMLPLLVDGQAALLPPATIDANTGEDALDVGASIGNRRAWAGFVQRTQGVQRLYASYAENGAFGAPALVDRGNAVTAAALAGNDEGNAVVVFTEPVGGKSVLFGRRLSGGEATPALEISAATHNAVIPSPFAGLRHVRVVALNGAGAAAVCYLDADSDNVHAATLAPNAAAWTRVGPLKNARCDDIAIDGRGNIVVVGQDLNGDLTADRIVNGALRSEVIDADGMDEPSVALTPSGTTIALARIMLSGGNFAAAAWRKRDIAQDGAWDKLGRVDNGVVGNNENTEFPRAALNDAGTGVVTFRVNDPATNTASIHFAIIDAGAATPLAAAQKLSDVAVGQEAVPNVEADGDPLVARQGTGSNAKTLPFMHVFSSGSPQPARPLVAESDEDVELLNVTSFVADGPGNFVALLRRYSTPTRIVGVFGDFVPPTLRPAARPRRPRLGQVVAVTTGATDSFATLGPESAELRFSRGAVQGAVVRRGSSASVRFLRTGRNRVVASATDRAGNRAVQTIQILVAPARPLFRVRPRTLVRGKALILTGARFLPRSRVTVLVQPPNAPARPIASMPATAAGAFRKRYRVPARWRPGRYLVVACQLRCRVKAQTRVRIR